MLKKMRWPESLVNLTVNKERQANDNSGIEKEANQKNQFNAE